jgi:hypothetical protein
MPYLVQHAHVVYLHAHRSTRHLGWRDSGTDQEACLDVLSSRLTSSWPPGAGLQPQRDASYRMGGTARAVTAWAGQMVY